jgi:hypothetical protein
LGRGCTWICIYIRTREFRKPFKLSAAGNIMINNVIECEGAVDAVAHRFSLADCVVFRMAHNFVGHDPFTDVGRPGYRIVLARRNLVGKSESGYGDSERVPGIFCSNCSRVEKISKK